MRAITLTQPWNGLMAVGIKRIENRSHPLISRRSIGARVAFHASRQIDEPTYDRIYQIAPELNGTFGLEPWSKMSRVISAITHVSTLIDILAIPDVDDADDAHRDRVFAEALARGTVTADQRRWYFGRYGYVFDDEKLLPTPVPCRGWQGFWTLPADVEAQVMAQLAARAA